MKPHTPKTNLRADLLEFKIESQHCDKIYGRIYLKKQIVNDALVRTIATSDNETTPKTNLRADLLELENERRHGDKTYGQIYLKKQIVNDALVRTIANKTTGRTT